MMTAIKEFRKESTIDKIVIAIFTLLLLVFLIFVGYPLVYVVVGSFMEPDQLLAKGMTFNVTQWNIDGYKKVLSDQTITHGFLMSMFYSFSFSIISIFISTTMAFPLSIKNLVGKKFINTLLIITLFFGGGLIPTFLLVKDLKMLDTVWAILLPGAISVWNIILARTFFQGIPEELREAAALDGCTNLNYFIQIVIPLSKPIMAVLFLYTFVGQWNSFFDAMIYLENPLLEPLQLVLRRILIQNEVPSGMISDQQAMYELKKIAAMVKYATIVISSVPLIMLYPFFQKYFEQGVMVGSLKG